MGDWDDRPWGEARERMHDHMWGDGSWGDRTVHVAGNGYGWVWALLLVILLATLVYVAVRLAVRPGQQLTAATPGGAVAAGTSARQILEDRLARGEIEPDEFRDRVKALDGE